MAKYVESQDEQLTSGSALYCSFRKRSWLPKALLVELLPEARHRPSGLHIERQKGEKVLVDGLAS